MMYPVTAQQVQTKTVDEHGLTSNFGRKCKVPSPQPPPSLHTNIIILCTKMSPSRPYNETFTIAASGQRHNTSYAPVSQVPMYRQVRTLVSEDSFSVWIVGSSIVKDLFYFLADKNFGLSQIGGYVEWTFKPEFRVHQLVPFIQELLAVKPPPYLLIIHCGGNDIGEVPLGNIQRLLKSNIQYIKNILPETRIVFSSILPRLYYRCEVNHGKLDKARKRLNTELSKVCIRLGGGYIRYPEITENQEIFRDFFHLSQKGLTIMSKHMHNALFTFCQSDALCYPE